MRRHFRDARAYAKQTCKCKFEGKKRKTEEQFRSSIGSVNKELDRFDALKKEQKANKQLNK